MVTIDEIKSLQARVQQKERELAEKARGMQEIQRQLQQDSKALHDKSDQFQKEQMRKMDETRKITEQLKRSDVMA